MRESLAGVAIVRRRRAGQAEWLARWNGRWGCYYFVAGHKHADETYRGCVVREIGEELALREGDGATVAAEPLARAEFVAWSESAQCDTAYTMELFEVTLDDPAQRRLDADSRIRWLTEDEVRAGRSRDDKRVSATMARLVDTVREGAGR